jgi:HAE1 family hydrophobic/amphiphilic exporter-1
LRIVETAAKRPISTLMVASGILLFGTVAFFQLKVELLPALHIPVVHVITEYPGMPAEETEQRVTIPLENSLSSVKGLRGMKSITKEEITDISLQFDWKVDLRNVVVNVREKIDAAYPYLPFGIQKPLVYTEDMNAEPILILGVRPKEGKSITDISSLVQKELCARLLRIPGVSFVRILGTTQPEIQVEGRGQELSAAGISLGDLSSLIASSVFSLPLGTLCQGGRERLINADTGVNSLESLKEIPIPLGTGEVGASTGLNSGSLKLRDLSSVRLGTKTRTSFFHIDGKEAIGIFIEKMPDAGSLNTARAVQEELPHLATLLGREIELEILHDATAEINSSLKGLIFSLLLGTVSVLLVLFWTFQDFRAPLLVSGSIPLSTASVFLFMYFCHITLNIVSLSGIAVGVGMIVDNSIVILENLMRNKSQGPAEIARDTREMTSAAFASTVTTILVFFPILFLPGVIGALFRDLALTISFLLLASFLVSLTLVPALYALLPQNRTRIRPARNRKNFSKHLYRTYLALCFRKLWIPAVWWMILVALGIGSFYSLPKEAIPKRESTRLELILSLPSGTPLEILEQESVFFSRRFLELPGIRKVLCEAGYEASSPRDKGAEGRNTWTLYVTLLLDGPISDMVERTLSEFLIDVSGKKNIHSTIQVPLDATSRLLGTLPGIQYRLQGDNREALLFKARTLTQQLENEGFLASWSSDTVQDLPRTHFQIQKDAAAFHGVSPRLILDSLEIAVQGQVVAQLPWKGEEIDIRVQGNERDLTGKEGLKKISIPVAGGFVKAEILGTVENEATYSELHRFNRKPSLTLFLRPDPLHRKDLETFLSYLESHPSSPAILETLASQSALKEGSQAALEVFGLAILLMYLLLGAQFESFCIPILLLSSFPLSLSGSLLLLALCGFSLNLNSFLGILILLGTTINSTILLTASYGNGTMNEIIRGSVLRVKPLEATVNTTLIALLPLLFAGKGEGALQANTAAALLGGLILGTVSILLTYPALYKVYRDRA